MKIALIDTIWSIRFCKQYKKPVILDPVSVRGATPYTVTSKKVYEVYKFIRGNARKIMAFAYAGSNTLDVESSNTTNLS